MAAKTDKHWLDAPEWWKKWRPLRWLSVLGVLAFIGSAYWGARELMKPSLHPETERYRALQPGVAMLSEFQSYASVEDVTAKLSAGGYQWTQAQSHKPVSPKYPPRDLDTLQLTGYKHFDTPGDLRLEFFNNRLYEAYFVPEDVSRYRHRLHASDRRIKRDRNGKSQLLAGNLRLASNVDLVASDVGKAYGAEPYVIWQDLSLIKQREEWDAAYGVVALRP